MRRALVIAFLAAAVAVPLSGCGKSGAKIPRSASRVLVARLQEANRRAQPLRCNDLTGDTIPALERQVATLPKKTDSGIRDTLNEAIGHLRDLVAAECRAKQQSKPPATTDTTTTAPSTQTQTQTQPPTSTQTQPPSTNTTTSPSTPTQPPSTPTSPSGGSPPGQQKKGGAQ